MAGVGVKLHRIYGKNSIVSKIAGFVYSTVLSIAPHASYYDISYGNGKSSWYIQNRICTKRTVFMYGTVHIYFFIACRSTI